jgi:hypothetical protein
VSIAQRVQLPKGAAVTIAHRIQPSAGAAVSIAQRVQQSKGAAVSYSPSPDRNGILLRRLLLRQLAPLVWRKRYSV